MLGHFELELVLGHFELVLVHSLEQVRGHSMEQELVRSLGQQLVELELEASCLLQLEQLLSSMEPKACPQLALELSHVQVLVLRTVDLRILRMEHLHEQSQDRIHV